MLNEHINTLASLSAHATASSCRMHCFLSVKKIRTPAHAVAGSSESILRTNLSAPRRANSKTLAFDPAIPERSERAQIPQPSAVWIRDMQQDYTIELGILSLKQIRRASLVDPTKSKTAPPLRTCNGSLASSFYAPHPRPGSGVCLSPDGKYLLRYGFSSEIKLIDASTAALVCTFRASLTSVGFAAFSTDGKHVIAATDDCRLLVFDMAKIGTPSMAVVSNIDVGLEPLLYCLMSPDGKRPWYAASSLVKPPS
eukprot:gene19004-25589_t